MKVFVILWVAIMLGLQFGCNKPQDTPPKPKVTRWVRIDLQLQSPLKSSMQGKWEYCGRVLNKGYFEYTVVPEELKRAGYLAYLLGLMSSCGRPTLGCLNSTENSPCYGKICCR